MCVNDDHSWIPFTLVYQQGRRGILSMLEVMATDDPVGFHWIGTVD